MGNKDYIIRNKHYIHAKQTYWCVFIISIILAVCSVYKFINDADNLFYIISSIIFICVAIIAFFGTKVKDKIK